MPIPMRVDKHTRLYQKYENFYGGGWVGGTPYSPSKPISSVLRALSCVLILDW